MSNIKKAFEKGKAFIAFITCGDPDLETTARAVRGCRREWCRSHRTWHTVL